MGLLNFYHYFSGPKYNQFVRDVISSVIEEIFFAVRVSENVHISNSEDSSNELIQASMKSFSIIMIVQYIIQFNITRVQRWTTTPFELDQLEEWPPFMYPLQQKK